MRKTIYSIMMVATMVLASCGGNGTTTTERVETDSIADSVVTEVVPQVETEVLTDSVNL